MTDAPPFAVRGLSDQFTLIIDGLCRAVAARAPGNLVAAPLLVLLWGRLRRLAARFARLVEQAASGMAPARRLRGARGERAARTGQRWPGGFAWLVRLVPEAAAYGSQLKHLLAQPEMAALIAAVPHAGRMFGPLGRMLAVQTGTNSPKPAKVSPVAPIPSPRTAPPDPVEPASGFLPSGVPYWARNAWPGHDFAGRDPPRRAPPAGGLKAPAVDRSD